MSNYLKGHLSGLLAAKAILQHPGSYDQLMNSLLNAIDQAELAIPDDENYLKLNEEVQK